MTTLGSAALFLLGLHLGMRTVAALYGILDHAYAWPRDRARVLARIAGWGGALALAGWLSGGPWVWRGAACELVGYLGTALLVRAAVAARLALVRRRWRRAAGSLPTPR